MKPICSWCDTKYALQGGVEYSIEELVDIIEKQPLTNIVCTGGEPACQYDDIIELIENLNMDYRGKELNKPYTFEIETNGLIEPDDFLCEEGVMFNVSPKRQNFNLKVLNKFNMTSNVNFKFVIENEDDFRFWQEQVIKKLGILPYRVWLMPEGTNSEKVKKGSIEIVDKYCLKYGYNLSPRLQVLLWGNEKGK